ncbi:UDP-N-acetylmuramate dehydrogenase [Pontivivens ytuae]|uniref:UDP-N-acetylenolpyruvoylglucosamine reductase n=1 Tax=Pontivivens ytuae TaxID=2789856 RepID=A0A7S9QE83_9RHOB|nr:UDP-N-acetylmuramate dehydrogenase [Pontivivens ytuae]QPH56058.1 UDP-N-acetylmuramate dehydrogenase [Pontivivens ytuae]
MRAPSPEILAELERHAPGRLRTGVDMSTLGRWQIGGIADAVFTPETPEEVSAGLGLLHESGTRHVVIGEGSNLLFDDNGYRGVLVVVGPAMSAFRADPETGLVEAEAGLWVPYFVLKTIRAGLQGNVHAAGIPGTLGGLVVMNGGSQRKGIGDQLVDVKVVEKDGRMSTLTRDDCAFSYRRSALQDRGATVVSARFRYEKGDTQEMRREAIAILAERRGKFPRTQPNCGSVFLSNPALYATLGPPGRAIEETGLKGTGRGGARISPRHANFIVNEGGARSEDVLHLIALARARVAERTGIAMDCEVRHLPPEGTLRPAHLSAIDLSSPRARSA